MPPSFLQVILCLVLCSESQFCHSTALLLLIVSRRLHAASLFHVVSLESIMPANKTGVNDPLPILEILMILAKLVFSFSIWLADQFINCGVRISEVLCS